MDPKYKPGDIVFRYVIKELTCEIEQYEILAKDEESSELMYPLFVYKAHKKGEEDEHIIAEGALYSSESEAWSAMMQELLNNKHNCEAKIMQAARIIALAQEELDHFDDLLYKYGEINNE